MRIRTEEPDYSSLPFKEHDWERTVCSGAAEEIPEDAPRPLGKRVQFTTYYDANLYHDLITGRSVTGALHLANKTVIDYYAKLQSTVETATFGSEFVAGRTATEQVMDIRQSFRYLGVPVETPTAAFGDNDAVVNAATTPHARLNKRHNALSFHRVREAVAAKTLRMHHIRGHANPSDLLSKHWDYPSVRSVLNPILFWMGDTADYLKSKFYKNKTKES